MDIGYLGSYHTHNRYCDGEGEIADVVAAAIDSGLAEVGISSHAPLPFETDWTMPLELLDMYVREARMARVQVTGTTLRVPAVLMGAEIDYVPDPRVAAFQQRHVFPKGFDYFVGSVHFLGRGYPPRSFDGTRTEFEAILRDDYEDDIAGLVVDYFRRVHGLLGMSGVRILAHLDLVKRWNADRCYFRGDEPWYVDAVEGILASIAASRHIVELNTSGWRKGLGEPYPSEAILRRCREMDIPVTVSADAHTPADVDWGYDRALECLGRLGIAPVLLHGETTKPV